MIKDLIEFFEDKKILILGFGREGKSSYKLIRKYLKNKQLYIADKQKEFEKDYEFLKEDKNVTIISGEKYLENLKMYDIIIKAPGISLYDANIYIEPQKIKSQLELLLEFFNIYTIGITGTKGKSTTSSLIYEILKDQNKKTMLLGNIGVPVFDYIDEIEDEMIIVLEMSSHQLEYMQTSPNIAIFLNVYEEHLDYYESFEKYVDAKCNIFEYQNKSDYLIYNIDNEVIKNAVKNANGITYKVSLRGAKGSNIYLKNEKVYFENKLIYDKNMKRNLPGDYNLNNIMFVLAVSEILKLNLDKTIKTIGDFKTLKHRLEFVGKYNDIFYYDNSIRNCSNGYNRGNKSFKKC